MFAAMNCFDFLSPKVFTDLMKNKVLFLAKQNTQETLDVRGQVNASVRNALAVIQSNDVLQTSHHSK